jgi:group I intron endonuclease
MLVYKITNSVNNKVYIGITTKSLDYRWRGHLIQLRQDNQRTIYRAMRKHGQENFSIEEIAQAVTTEELGLLEQKYILQYNSFGSGGYNMCAGGVGPLGLTHSEETRNKIKVAVKNKPPCSEETRKKLSIAGTGRKIPAEAVARQVAKRTGAKRTPEQCVAITAGRIGKGLKNDGARKHPKEIVFKAIELIKSGLNNAKISRETGLDASYISRLKAKKRGHSILGEANAVHL